MKNRPRETPPRTVIYPVISAVPPADAACRPGDRAAALSRHARRALAISAQKSGLRLCKLQKDQNGAPLPDGGCYWSLTHKRCYVGAVAADFAVGIDIEAVKNVSDGLCRKVAAESEWRLGRADDPMLFFRYWTAKEAVLKAVGVGLSALSACRVQTVMDRRHLRVLYRDRSFEVAHFYFNGHVASVVRGGAHVEWTLLPTAGAAAGERSRI